MSTSLTRGIRQRENGSFVVERLVDGVRRPLTVKTLEEAVRIKEALRKGVALLPEPPKVEPAKPGSWTLGKAIDVVFRTPCTEKVPGFKGSKCEETPRLRLEVITRYFGERFPLDKIRRATEEDDEEARTLDGLIEALRVGPPLVPRPNKDATINRYLNTLHKTLVLARHKKGLDEMPDWPGQLREGKFKIRFYSDEEEIDILRWCDTYENAGQGGRPIEEVTWFREMMITLIDTGIRWGEFALLEPSDVDCKVGILLVHGVDGLGTKNGEHRSVPMTKRVMEIMRRRVLARDFPFKHSYDRCHWIFTKMREDLGLAKDKLFTIHTARHTCASRLVQRGIDPMVVKEWLGHKHLTTTQRYMHLRPKNLLNAVHVLEPAA